MKNILVIGCIVFHISFSLQAKNVEQAFWISTSSLETLQLLKSRTELTIDHLEQDGFEIYGPKGLKEFLTQNNIPHTAIETASKKAISAYPSPEEIEKELKDIAKKYPDLCQMVSIGKSAKGKDLWMIKISKNVQTENTRPEFHFIANMHGDEIVGRELMVKLIKDILTNYNRDFQITNLVDHLQIYIMPSLNPDGAALAQRGNGNNIDLNRDFPDFTTKDNQDTLEGRQPETQAIMKWQKNKNFVLSANFHGGAEVVNYPWDTAEAAYPQDALVKDISLEYAGFAPYIGTSTVFNNGITNGYAWYEIDGGMQDWNNYYRNNLHITIELSKDKWPSYSQVQYYYEQNRPALLHFIERTLSLSFFNKR